MCLLLISSSLQVADCFTTASLRLLLPKLGMVDLYHPLAFKGLMKNEEDSRANGHTIKEKS